MSKIKLTCEGCGECCKLHHPMFDVELSEEDDVPQEMTEYRAQVGGNNVAHWMKRKEDGNCIAFDALHVRCSIYDRRPKECREFEVGSEMCLYIRAGLRVPSNLNEISARLKAHKRYLSCLMDTADCAIADANKTLEESVRRKADLENALRELEGDDGKEKV